MGLISRKLCRFFLTYVFDWLYFTQCLTSFTSINQLRHYALLFILFHLTEIRFSRSTHLYVFVFGNFNIHHKDWLTSSGGTDWPGELCYTFSISNNLTQMVNFPTWIPPRLWFSQSCSFGFIFFFLMLVFVLQWLFLHWEILIMFLSQSPLTLHQIQNGMPHFIA